jgi:putative transposase
MNIMGLQAIYKRAEHQQKHPQHRIYPYLLRKLAITRPNHVCSDILHPHQERLSVSVIMD